MSFVNETLSKKIYVVLRRLWIEELNEEFYSYIGINHLKLNRNLSTIVIYLDLEYVKTLYSKEEIMKKLKKLTPFLKYRLIGKLNLPSHCKLIFEEDLFIQKARRVESLIESSR
ncbi:ribosome-binding factor A [Candidatus Mycoplasma haematolamae str. Purdue]|uniref:Ribosome-binding factor A n=1 Tax=Mycoplasma haematolamae (strain Purdue) TaxID=1212765 RepID=I7CEN4_MYCHA|nr:ribosome-binding factor A [Candidatus Mycoplasma haematolamae]AFO51706.1 ribosome-binding factor A [Candidatus Mycoplasma haematolamae str. Purdue]